MLRELRIKNVAVIEEALVSFNDGFQVLTGETGAGKSILIDSINMALGERVSRDIIRSGEDFSQVDITFEVVVDKTINEIADLGVDASDGIVLISRKISTDGKSKCNINGRLMPLNIVKEIGEKLINIHGQNDNQNILSSKSHIVFLDAYAENESIKDEYLSQYKKVKDIWAEIDALNTDENEKERLVELLSFQVGEIDEAKLKIGEEEELLERRDFLANAEKIVENAGGAYYNLHGGNESGGAYDDLMAAVKKLDNIKDYDAKVSGYCDTLTSVLADVEDVMYELRSYIDSINYSEKELDSIENRLSLIASLKRKYGRTVEEILVFAEKGRERLSAIGSSDERLIELNSELNKEKAILNELGERLTRSRVDASIELQKAIMVELSELDMQKIRFSVSVSPLYDGEGEVKYTRNGCDNVEFMISANPGEALKPLSKIASGGEMSRIMLAIKSVLSDSDRVETMIFDEIDTGVSGRAAQKIAEKIGMISKKIQILCITHLAQIAAMADYHYLIEKNSDDLTTKTTVRCVEDSERVSELARIIGGVVVTDKTVEAAREMLALAENYKNLLGD